MNTKIGAVIGGFLLFIAGNAVAECRKAHVCDDYGMNCRIQQVCDSNLDLPSIEVDPIRPLPSMQVKPLPSMELPPLGTSRCQLRQVNGMWQNICD